MHTKLKSALGSIKKAGLVTLVLMVLCGLFYPLALTGLSMVFFPHQAKGSVIEVDGVAVGSTLVGQQFTDPRFLWGRPSAVGYNTYTEAEKEAGDYTGPASGSQNYAPTNPALIQRVTADMAAFLAANPQVRREDIPTDLLTASGSGLDPHISPDSAAIQIPRLVQSTGLSQARLEEIIQNHTQGKLLGIFSEAHVNVLLVNLDIARELGIL